MDRSADIRPDEQLMQASAGGDSGAFAVLVRRHQDPLLNFFRRMGVYMEAEDLVQETFVRLFKYRDRYEPTAKFTTFLYTIARHARLDLLRKHRRKEGLLRRFGEESPTADESGMELAASRLDADAALRRLPEKLRNVVVLSLYQGLNYDEIAGVLRIPQGTVKSRMFLALSRLKEAFHDGKQ